MLFLVCFSLIFPYLCLLSVDKNFYFSCHSSLNERNYLCLMILFDLFMRWKVIKDYLRNGSFECVLRAHILVFGKELFVNYIEHSRFLLVGSKNLVICVTSFFKSRNFFRKNWDFFNNIKWQTVDNFKFWHQFPTKNCIKTGKIRSFIITLSIAKLRQVSLPYTALKITKSLNCRRNCSLKNF